MYDLYQYNCSGISWLPVCRLAYHIHVHVLASIRNTHFVRISCVASYAFKLLPLCNGKVVSMYVFNPSITTLFFYLNSCDIRCQYFDYKVHSTSRVQNDAILYSAYISRV